MWSSNKQKNQYLIEAQCKYKLQKCYHIVDSQIVHAMIQKESYGLNTLAATQIGEIQEGTNVEDWYWTESKHNIADWLTRGKTTRDIETVHTTMISLKQKANQ